MKKIILASLAVLAINSAFTQNCASSFTGFYAGGQTGLNATRTKYDAITVTSNLGAGTEYIATKKKNGIIAGLFSGYGMGIGSCGYAGAEFYLNLANTGTSYEVDKTVGTTTI